MKHSVPFQEPVSEILLPPSSQTLFHVAASESLRGRSQWEDLARAAGYDLTRLARLCNVSTRTLQRYFARQGLRGSHWLRELRLKEAYQSLLSGERVKVAALDCGYEHLSNFSRDFKQQFGVPPSCIAGGCCHNNKERLAACPAPGQTSMAL